MSGNLSGNGFQARNSNGGNTGTSAADDADWFAEGACEIYKHKPGTILFLITGLGDERLCQRYASGEFKPKAYFLRRLLRGDHGRQWINWTMHGSSTEWWLEHQDALKLKRVIDNR